MSLLAIDARGNTTKNSYCHCVCKTPKGQTKRQSQCGRRSRAGPEPANHKSSKKLARRLDAKLSTLTERAAELEAEHATLKAKVAAAETKVKAAVRSLKAAKTLASDLEAKAKDLGFRP